MKPMNTNNKMKFKDYRALNSWNIKIYQLIKSELIIRPLSLFKSLTEDKAE